MIKKEIPLGEVFIPSQKTKILFLMSTVAFVITLTATGFPGMASAQENKTAMQSQGLQSTATNTTEMNVILVHGAWVDGSSWSEVIPILEKSGHRVIAVQLPLHSLADDVNTVKRAIDLAGGPTVLVGHSYGGTVITNAAYNNPNVKGLVYISAFAPNDGQSTGDYFDVNKLPKGLVITDSGGFLYLNSSKFHDAFAQDASLAQADIAAAVQKPINQSIFAQKSGPPAWKQVPTWYLVSENDNALPPDTQRMFAKQMNATTVSLPVSHASFLSHPNEVAKLILDAAKGSR